MRAFGYSWARGIPEVGVSGWFSVSAGRCRMYVDDEGRGGGSSGGGAFSRNDPLLLLLSWFIDGPAGVGTETGVCEREDGGEGR